MGPRLKSLLAACLSIAVVTDGQAQQRPPQPAPAAPAKSLRAALSDDVIRQAVKDTLAADSKPGEQSHGRALSAERYDSFSRQFDDAKVPGCLQPDGLKNQPTYFFAGLLAAPFIAIAALRGKCN